jgi:hypothetical protein
MKTSASIVSAIVLALVVASPAEAAKTSKHKRAAAPRHATMQQQAAAVPAGAGFQGGVLKGPLYNGQDYLGDDPDPNIRAFILKNLSGRYGSSY